MSDTILVSTRKGLFFVERGARGWSVGRTSFLGDPVTLALHADGQLFAALNLGHFGVKLRRSNDGEKWDDVGVPAYPPTPPDEKDGIGRPLEWKLSLIWALERGAPGELWCGTIPGGLFRSTDGGATWALNEALWNDPRRKKWLGGGYDAPGIHSICVHPTDANKLTVGVSCGGVWRSDDGGASWRVMTKGMFATFMPPDQREVPEIQDPHRVVQCRSRPEVLWTQHHNGVFKSADDAASWQSIENVPPSVFGFAVAVHPSDAETAWLVPAEKDERRVPVDGKMVVARTRDGGASWTALREGLPQQHAYDLVYRHGLDVDESGARLVLGSTTGGLWISEDGGDSFATVSTHLPPIYAVRFI